MLFNSLPYALFLPAVALGYFALPQRLRWMLLLAASYFFYASWNPKYLLLLLASTLVDYALGVRLAEQRDPRRRRALLTASICMNLGLLFTFKYWNFVQGNLVWLAERMGYGWPLGTLDVLLPVGISFYTFQSLAYVVDVYRGAAPAERHLGRFALYVAFFPQLVAGPIERAGRLMPQLRMPATVDLARIRSGLELIVWGLFKKVVVADRLALYVDIVYANPTLHTSGSRLLATYFFAFQIYADFSAYTDIARGSARILGIELIENFQTPYFAASSAEFWRRWHISLSTWLRDYLYIPLGGNRRGLALTYTNLWITMLLGGLWHGASWSFVIWGALHGTALALGRASAPLRERIHAALGTPAPLRRALGILCTFHLVCAGWVFFRAATLGDALTVLGALLGPYELPLVDPSTLAHGLLGLAVLLAVDLHRFLGGDARARLEAAPPPLRWAAWYGIAFAIVLLGVESGSQFIYFQF
jgi:D-alanyl-lipoteichoic acid acyltransferase DltB (MBOAT superfamily)